ncbi:hypothetical protein ACFXTN_027716 [Malus domestica]
MSWKTSRFPKNQESSLRSSFFVHRSFKIKPRRPLKKAPSFIIRSSKIKPQRPFGSTIIHLQDQAPTALEESVLRSSFFQDQAPTALWINKRRQIHTSNRSSRLSPKALEDLFITVSSRSSPKTLEDPLKSTFKDQAHDPLKKLPTEFSVFTNWHARWDNLYLSSLSPFKESKHTSKSMASSKGQAVLATTEGRILSTSAANGQSISATTAPQHATSKLVPLKEQGEHPRCESVINLTSLGAPKHDAKAHKMTSQSNQRRSSSASWMSKGKSRLLVAQVMTIGVTSVEEQLAQMNEAIVRLTRTVEEKDLQIAALVNRLEPHDDENPNPEDEPQVEKNDAKPEPDQAAALMGSLSIQ